MKFRYLLGVLVSVFMLLFISCAIQDSASSKKEMSLARQKLESMEIAFTEQSFIDCSRAGNIEAMKLFLQAGINVNSNQNETPLTSTVRANNYDATKFLLDHGADVNLASYWETPIGVASYNGFDKIAELLIKSGADVNTLAKDGMTPLTNAIITKRPTMVELLLNSGANPNYELPDTGETPLIIAARYGNNKIVELLVADGANLNSKDDGKMSALDWAITNKYWDCSATLINKGAFVNDGDKSSRPMLLVMVSKKFDIADMLIAKGENINSLAYNTMPLVVWCAKNNNYEAVKYLISKGVRINKRDASGQNALDYAILNKDQPMIDILKAVKPEIKPKVPQL
ncbi:MAG: ankyrin repeat domain-containing protein [Lentisphaerota bacterium]